MGRLPAIQIVFVGANGKSTNGPLIVPPTKIRKLPELKDEVWTRDQAIRRFQMYLRKPQKDGLEAAMRALTRHDCWRAALDKLRNGPGPDPAMAAALLSFWFTYGLHSIPRALKENLVHLVDVFAHLLPSYAGPGLTLYRGELEARYAAGIYGIAWTPLIEKARQFARRREPDEGQGVVLKIDATPDMIVAALREHSQHTLTLEEDEYIVDPRKIKGKVSVDET
jgi:hypothetical protein